MAEALFEVVRRPEGTDESGRGDVVIRLSVQPGAGRSSVVGRHGDALRVRVAPPPVDGRANDAVVALVAEVLGVPTSQVELVAGQRSRQKRVRVADVLPGDVDRRLERAIDKAAIRPGPGGPARLGR